MINRRSVLNGTALGSALAALAPQPALEARGEAAVQGNSDRNVSIDTSGIISALNALQAEARRQDSFWEIELVRRQILTFLRQAGKYPDYIEVGTDVWHQVYDWHVRYQQPKTVARTAEGRYTILLYSTQVIMRTELAASYIGQPYDNR
jgi:hypothetical protein